MQGLVFAFVFLFTTSCGALRLNPIGCRGNGILGDRFYEGKQDFEMQFTETYYVWNSDNEVRLKDFLKKRNFNCNDIKKMRVTIKSVFFVKRELTVFVQK